MAMKFGDPSDAGPPPLARILMSRRNAMVLGAAASLALVAGDPAAARAAALPGSGLIPANGFDALRERWLDHLTGRGGSGMTSPAATRRIRRLSRTAAGYLDAADRTPSSGGNIWSDLPMAGPDPANVSTTYHRILTVATAWATAGTGQYREHDVAGTLVGWYRHMTGSWYHAGVEPAGNWWFWEIGIPRVLGDLSVLLLDRLPSDDVGRAVRALRRFTPDPNRIEASDSPATGANRADKCLSCLLRGIVARSSEDIELARDALSDRAGGGAGSLFRYVSEGDGFYSDGSYIHHLRLPYAGSYGKAALTAVAPSVMLLAGSPWDISTEAMEPLLDSVERTFAPFIWNGRMLEVVRGRAVAREHETGSRVAWETMEAMLLLAGHVDRRYARQYLGLAKGWLERSDENYFESATTLSDLRRAEKLLADGRVEPVAEPVGSVYTAAQERLVHRGDGWAFTVATSSSRIGRFGWGNGENRYGWHQGDGASYLYLENDPGQFSDDYWPTVDPYRLPGTTASIVERSPGPDSGTPVPEASNRWGGGLSLAGRWGSAGMHLENEIGDVTGRKSWFLLEDSVVAVGSGIVVTGPGAETTMENRSFPAGRAPRFLVDGQEIAPGESRGLDAPTWAHLDGVAGYAFLGTYAARASIEDRSGSWRDINTGGDTAGSPDTRTRTYATLSLVHPSGTGGDRYAYVVLPGASARATRAHATGGGTRVVRDDPQAHVVRAWRGSRWYLFANLWEATDIGPVRANGPCAVIVTGDGSGSRVAVSDPTRSGTDVVVRVDTPRRPGDVSRSDDGLRIHAGDLLGVEANLSANLGATLEATLSL